MSIVLRMLFLLAFPALAVAQATHAGLPPAGITYQALLTRLDSLKVDSASHRIVTGLFFEDGIYSITLDSGSVAFLEPVEGRRIAAVFRGTCNVSFSPNHPTEVVNLGRFHNGKVFAKACTSAVFVFGDDRLV